MANEQRKGPLRRALEALDPESRKEFNMWLGEALQLERAGKLPEQAAATLNSFRSEGILSWPKPAEEMSPLARFGQGMQDIGVGAKDFFLERFGTEAESKAFKQAQSAEEALVSRGIPESEKINLGPLGSVDPLRMAGSVTGDVAAMALPGGAVLKGAQALKKLRSGVPLLRTAQPGPLNTAGRILAGSAAAGTGAATTTFVPEDGSRMQVAGTAALLSPAATAGVKVAQLGARGASNVVRAGGDIAENVLKKFDPNSQVIAKIRDSRFLLDDTIKDWVPNSLRSENPANRSRADRVNRAMKTVQASLGSRNFPGGDSTLVREELLKQIDNGLEIDPAAAIKAAQIRALPGSPQATLGITGNVGLESPNARADLLATEARLAAGDSAAAQALSDTQPRIIQGLSDSFEEIRAERFAGVRDTDAEGVGTAVKDRVDELADDLFERRAQAIKLVEEADGRRVVMPREEFLQQVANIIENAEGGSTLNGKELFRIMKHLRSRTRGKGDDAEVVDPAPWNVGEALKMRDYFTKRINQTKTGDAVAYTNKEFRQLRSALDAEIRLFRDESEAAMAHTNKVSIDKELGRFDGSEKSLFAQIRSPDFNRGQLINMIEKADGPMVDELLSKLQDPKLRDMVGKHLLDEFQKRSEVATQNWNSAAFNRLRGKIGDNSMNLLFGSKTASKLDNMNSAGTTLSQSQEILRNSATSVATNFGSGNRLTQMMEPGARMPGAGVPIRAAQTAIRQGGLTKKGRLERQAAERAIAGGDARAVPSPSMAPLFVGSQTAAQMAANPERTESGGGSLQEVLNLLQQTGPI